ncbi:MAG: DUF456 domain-containing protein [Bacteroidales bacterium]|nr:DUF456 domain-containing protein [Bacteroidales bacterium]
MILDYFLIALAIILLILGFLGCIMPIIPGPPLSWLGLLAAYFTKYWGNAGNILLWTGVLALAVTIIDYVLPIWVTKKMGGTKRGIWGATIGLAVGVFLLPPFGIIVVPFVGALLGEYSNKHSETKSNPWRSATGSLLGFLLGTGLKFATSGIIAYHFVVEIFLR